ncbi:thioesterase family protein [Proteocatella sphenisci]|uniref:thioesterase family protein n=1 Tax=Proteocatella sphenisci TaxID=181070 RepID=UPI00048FA9ED|nr:hypothetical protein [Proteocatella sphenisci]
MLKMPEFEIGGSITIQKTVTEDDIASNYGNPELDRLFATPSLVALMISASTKLIDEKLDEGLITIGKEIHVIHEKPTLIGQTLTIKVTVKERIENTLKLEMLAFDEIGVIGRGNFDRVIVSKEALMRKVHVRESLLESRF